MATTIKGWRKSVEKVLAKEGIRDLTWSYTSGNHQRISGTILVEGGRELPVSMTCSLSPSDVRAIHRVRRDCRIMLRAARSMSA